MYPQGHCFHPRACFERQCGLDKNIAGKTLFGRFQRPYCRGFFGRIAKLQYSYDVYIQKAGTTREEDYTYRGIAIYWAKKKVNRLTGSLPLLRWSKSSARPYMAENFYNINESYGPERFNSCDPKTCK